MCIHCRGKIDATGVKQIALPVADALDIVAGNSTEALSEPARPHGIKNKARL